jgi:hypothetical protein
MVNLSKLDGLEQLEELNNFQTINIKSVGPVDTHDISDNLNLLKLIIQYNIEPNEYYNPSNVKSINYLFDLTEFNNIFNGLKIGGLCYNHMLKLYCYIDLYDDINIIEISTIEIISREKFIESIIKLIISNKQIINFYNPIKGQILRLEISELIQNKIKQLIIK